MILNQRICATIEARMTSSRLPGKVLMDVLGKPMLERMVERLKTITCLDDIIIATTINDADDPIEELAGNLGIGCHRGSEANVMERVLHAAQSYDVDIIVETTGDCPLIDPEIVARTIREYASRGVDYVANNFERSYPIGMDTQVFSTAVLADAFSRTSDPLDHEHVSLFIYRHPELYTLYNVSAPAELHDPQLRLTLDTVEDLQVVRAIFGDLLAKNANFKLGDMLEYLRNNPEVRMINSDIEHRWV